MTKSLPILIPTAVKNFSKKKGLIFLGEWCNRYEKKYNTKSSEYHWNNLNKINQDSKILEKYYEKLLKNLAKKMNILHKEKKNLNYWRILIGPWLYFYITVLFDRWETLDNFFKKNKKKKFLFYSSNFFFQDYDTNDFVVNARLNDAFNYSLFSKIIQYQYLNRVKIISKPAISFYNRNFKVEKNGLIKTLFNPINKILSFLSIRYNDVILDLPYLSKKNYLSICYKLKILPSFDLKVFSNNKTNNLQKNEKDRRLMKIKIKSKNKFFNFITKDLNEYIPKIFLEDFKSIKLLNKKYNNGEKKLIITSANYLENERFKFWIAEMQLKKNKLCVYRHGGFIDQQIRDNYTFNHLSKISYKYLDWNKNKISNAEIFSPLQLLRFKNIKSQKAQKCLVIEPSIYPYNIKCAPFPYNENVTKNFEYTKIFLKKLNKDVQSQTILRIVNTDGREYLKKDLKKNFSSIEICNLKKKFVDRVKESRIVVCKYLDTPISEVSFSDVPFVIVLPKEFYLKKGHEKIFNNLKKNKILFENPLLAAKHINKYWNKMEIWWNNKNTIKCRNQIKSQIGRINENWLEESVLKIKKLKNEKR
tara:strand:+ start:3597 stop:5360 length:1764 start_codon:yes stop_codon:yes gene_type:complete